MTNGRNDDHPHRIGFGNEDLLWVLAMLQTAEAETIGMGLPEARRTRARIAGLRDEIAAKIPFPILSPEMPYTWYTTVSAMQDCQRYAVRIERVNWTRRDLVVEIDGARHVLARHLRDEDAAAHFAAIAEVLDRLAPLGAIRGTSANEPSSVVP